VWPALVVGSDPRADIAVLKIPATKLTPVKFADESTFHRGQWTIALGNPFGLAVDGQSCMSVGVDLGAGPVVAKTGGQGRPALFAH
jgi:serine protease Do